MSKRKIINLRRVGIFAAIAFLVYVLAIWLGRGIVPVYTELKPVVRPEDFYGKKYTFSNDWFTHNIPVWEKMLEEFKGKPNIHYLEVGVFEGRSAIWALESILTDPTARMTCIDIFPEDLEEKFLANLRLSGKEKKATVIKGYSNIALRKLPLDSFDIIYIDGSHTANDVMTDAVLSWELLKQGGILIFDDYIWAEDLPPIKKPKIAVDAFLLVYREYIEVIHRGYQLILKRI